jgi:hypothetical protein
MDMVMYHALGLGGDLGDEAAVAISEVIWSGEDFMAPD